MPFKIQALPYSRFSELFDLTDTALAARRAVRVTADAQPGYPCRVSLEDAAPGETVLLVNYEHQGAASPFRSSHAIYIRERATEAHLPPETLPPFFGGG